MLLSGSFLKSAPVPKNTILWKKQHWNQSLYQMKVGLRQLEFYPLELAKYGGEHVNSHMTLLNFGSNAETV